MYIYIYIYIYIYTSALLLLSSNNCIANHVAQARRSHPRLTQAAQIPPPTQIASGSKGHGHPDWPQHQAAGGTGTFDWLQHYRLHQAAGGTSTPDWPCTTDCTRKQGALAPQTGHSTTDCTRQQGAGAPQIGSGTLDWPWHTGLTTAPQIAPGSRGQGHPRLALAHWTGPGTLDWPQPIPSLRSHLLQIYI